MARSQKEYRRSHSLGSGMGWAFGIALVAVLASMHMAHADEGDCLARTMWGEARGEGPSGMVAVADVVMNRAVRDGRTVCAEATAPAQFQGYGRGGVPPAWVRDLAFRAASGPDHVRGATHFVRVGTRARWLRRMWRVAVVGHHLFLAPR